MYDILEIIRTFKLRPKRTSTIMDINKRETLTYDRVQKDIQKLLNIMKLNIKIKIKRIKPNTFYLSPLEIDDGK